MSEFIQLKAADGHTLDAYLAQPAGKPKAGIVVIQEIFGITAHIRSVVDGYAKDGYLVIAPALFDRAQRHVEYKYDQTGMQEGYAIVKQLPIEGTLADIQAAITYLRQQPGIHKVGVVGYCWGGTLAWLSNTRLHPDATVSYYGGGIQNYITEKSSCPAIFHFGLEDTHISQTVVEQVRHEYPGYAVYTYESAGHAFNRDVDDTHYNKEAAALARQRTLAHFEEHLAGSSHS
ncbi:MAG TPA: dienelactone hydrolase family protein [Acidobacteriaceae bacterium]|nr:dienelactone hydrolase family protein [Acidobacteriaceae bacterium]